MSVDYDEFWWVMIMNVNEKMNIKYCKVKQEITYRSKSTTQLPSSSSQCAPNLARALTAAVHQKQWTDKIKPDN